MNGVIRAEDYEARLLLVRYICGRLRSSVNCSEVAAIAFGTQPLANLLIDDIVAQQGRAVGRQARDRLLE